MTTEQLIDEQIIKALECCTKHEKSACDKCPYDGLADYVDGLICSECLIDDAFSLINRQKAEIERLKKHLQFAEELYCRKEMTEDEGK